MTNKINTALPRAKLERAGWRPDWSLDRGIQELMRGYRMPRNSRYANV